MDGIERCIDDEIPFDIPENWVWARFGTAMINRDAERIPLSVNEREKLQKIYDYYGASGVIDKVDRYLFSTPLLLIGEHVANQSLLLQKVNIGLTTTLMSLIRQTDYCWSMSPYISMQSTLHLM